MTHIKTHTITKKDVDLSQLSKLIETATGIKLMADEPTDAVDGYINISGDKIEIFMYDEEELPNKEHKSMLRKKISTKAENISITNIINSFIKS